MYSHPPLSRRVVKDRSRGVCVTSEEMSREMFSLRGKYKGWDSRSMHKAIKEVELGMSIRRAAEIYSVPKSSLYDRINGKVHCGATPGPNPYLTYKEEEELASFLIQTAKIGYPHTKKQVLALVQRIIESKGIEASISNGWWERFRKRHPFKI